MSYQIISCIKPKWIVSPAIDDLCECHNQFYYNGLPQRVPYSSRKKFFRSFGKSLPDPENVVFYHNGLKVPAFIQVSCGECFCCNETRRQDVAQRIMLEMTSHCYAPMWCTLTYREEDVGDNILCYAEFQSFIKRLRALYPHPLRFCAVGEYGKIDARKHWHCFLFGFKLPTIATEFDAINRIEFAWRHGHVNCRKLDNVGGTAKYVTKYVTKKGDIIQKWSKGLGSSAVQNFRSYFHESNPTVEPKYLDFFGNLRKLRVNSWVLDNVFGNVAKATYDLRNLVRDYYCSDNDYLPSGLKEFLQNIGSPLKFKNYERGVDYNKLLDQIERKFALIPVYNLLQNHLKRYEYIARFRNTLTYDLVNQREHIYKINYYRRKSFQIL